VVYDRRTQPGPSTATAPAGPSGSCGGRAAADPDRPVVDLRFSLAEDRRTVTGTERVVFTPDLPVDELVFRLVANGPSSAEAGSRLTVDAVRGTGLGAGGYEAAGAEPPGGLYVVPLPEVRAAGEPVEAELDFTLTLGAADFERYGTADGVSWWASGAPLLAWEPGVGWARDPFVELLGETASSPVADTSVVVEAPAGLTVLMTGDQQPPSAPSGGRRTWASREPHARDVSVAVGEFATAETDVDGVRVTTGVLPGDGGAAAAEQLLADTADAIEALTGRLGPFPYATLTVPLVGEYGGGIEYPSSILMADVDGTVLVHEVAHMWFYGMVGDSQYRDPWLDEAFASYAESVVAEPDPERVERLLARPGDVGASMGAFPDDRSYVTAVYGKGAAMLLAARQAAGPAAFDAAVRCYVDEQAWTTATPADVARALRGLPAALDVLVTAGALDAGDLPR
jgi:hypothetical protein